MKEKDPFSKEALKDMFKQMDENVASNVPICREKINLLPPKKPSSLSAKVHDIADNSMSLSFKILIGGAVFSLAGGSLENSGMAQIGLGIFAGGTVGMFSSMVISQFTLRAKLEDIRKNIYKK